MTERNLVSLLGDVVGLIPPEQAELRHTLLEIRQSARYTAPEMMPLRWRMAHEAIAKVIGDSPQAGWQQRVAETWGGKRGAA